MSLEDYVPGCDTKLFGLLRAQVSSTLMHENSNPLTRIELPAAIVFSHLEPVRWVFSSKKSGDYLRKNSDGVNPKSVYQEFRDKFKKYPARFVYSSGYKLTRGRRHIVDLTNDELRDLLYKLNQNFTAPRLYGVLQANSMVGTLYRALWDGKTTTIMRWKPHDSYNTEFKVQKFSAQSRGSMYFVKPGKTYSRVEQRARKVCAHVAAALKSGSKAKNLEKRLVLDIFLTMRRNGQTRIITGRAFVQASKDEYISVETEKRVEIEDILREAKNAEEEPEVKKEVSSARTAPLPEPASDGRAAAESGDPIGPKTASRAVNTSRSSGGRGKSARKPRSGRRAKRPGSTRGGRAAKKTPWVSNFSSQAEPPERPRPNTGRRTADAPGAAEAEDLTMDALAQEFAELTQKNPLLKQRDPLPEPGSARMEELDKLYMEGATSLKLEQQVHRDLLQSTIQKYEDSKSSRQAKSRGSTSRWSGRRQGGQLSGRMPLDELLSRLDIASIVRRVDESINGDTQEDLLPPED